MKFTLTINNIAIAFTTQWENCDGEGWEFGVTIDVPCDNLPCRQSDELRNCVSIECIANALVGLDDDDFFSDLTPLPQIGPVAGSTLNELSKKLMQIKEDTFPQCSAHDSYFGI